MPTFQTLDRYLAAILTLKEKYLCVRAVDVAHYLGYSKTSVSVMLRSLREKELITVESDGNLCLLPAGQKRTEAYMDRFTFFHRLLLSSGVEPGIAFQDAILLSTELSAVSFDKLQAYLSKSKTQK